jgi:predicted ATPase
MELLLRRWAQAKAGDGRVVLTSAEPGVGKSRLAEAMAERIATESVLTFTLGWSAAELRGTLAKGAGAGWLVDRPELVQLVRAK